MEEQLNDDFFANYSKKVMADRKAAEDRKNNPQTFEYEELAYAGLEKGIFKVVRLIGAPIGAEKMGYKRKPTDPKEILECEVKDDEGKRFTIRMPIPDYKDKANNYILWRLYNKVCEKIYIDKGNGKKESIDINKTKHPELYELATKGGFTPDDGNTYTYSHGYKGDRLAIYNVVDKTDDWCKNNKHSKLLARSVNIDDQNRVWGKAGLKSASLLEKVEDLISKDGNPEKFDIAIKKTGKKDPALVVLNASKMKNKDMMEELVNDDGTETNANKIDTNPIPEGIELYDLDKLFHPTSYQSLLKRVPKIFQLCDATLGTNFYPELQQRAEKEKAEWEAQKAEREAAQAEVEQKKIQEQIKSEPNLEAENPALSDDAVFGVNPSFDEMPKVEEEKPATRRRAPAGLTADKIALLKGWNEIADDIKSRIVDVEQAEDKVKITWNDTSDLLECDECGSMSPESASHCPVCACRF